MVYFIFLSSSRISLISGKSSTNDWDNFFSSISASGFLGVTSMVFFRWSTIFVKGLENLSIIGVCDTSGKSSGLIKLSLAGTTGGGSKNSGPGGEGNWSGNNSALLALTNPLGIWKISLSFNCYLLAKNFSVEVGTDGP